MAHLYRQFTYFFEQVANGDFSPQIYYEGEDPVEFSSIPLTHLENYRVRTFDSISEVIRTYYASRDTITRIRQK
ncbi:NFACT family protein, partial [Klebsiella pneumoniae]|nr:NFACT family protein [Klebsiella pneumoniae]